MPLSPNSNANPKPNPDPDQGAIFLGGNFPDTFKVVSTTHTAFKMQFILKLVNCYNPLTNVTKSFILNDAKIIDMSLPCLCIANHLTGFCMIQIFLVGHSYDFLYMYLSRTFTATVCKTVCNSFLQNRYFPENVLTAFSKRR